MDSSLISTISEISPEIASSMGFLLNILKTLGILFIIYILFLIVSSYFNIKRGFRIKKIYEKIYEIDKKLDNLIQQSDKGKIEKKEPKTKISKK